MTLYFTTNAIQKQGRCGHADARERHRRARAFPHCHGSAPRRCRELLETWRRGREPWYTTWAILYEFARVVTHARVLPDPWTAEAALGFVQAIIESPSHRVLVASERHAALAQEMSRSVPALGGNLFHDFHTAVLMREHSIARIYTRDADFRRFAFLDVIDPLA